MDAEKRHRSMPIAAQAQVMFILLGIKSHHLQQSAPRPGLCNLAHTCHLFEVLYDRYSLLMLLQANMMGLFD